MIPFIQLYALYVVFHGHYSPGGGFQGGVIMATSFILFSLVFGQNEGEKRFPEKTVLLLACTGMLIYSGIGLSTLLLGGAFLDYSFLPISPPAQARSLGILGVEIGVGFTVASIIYLIFSRISRR
jgi:multicomponent Na+:H+ antiporter subunit B